MFPLRIATGRQLMTFELPERTDLVSANGLFPSSSPRETLSRSSSGSGCDDQVLPLGVASGERSSSVTSLPFEPWLAHVRRDGQLQVRDLADGSLLVDLKTQPFQQPPWENCISMQRREALLSLRGRGRVRFAWV